MNASEKNAHLKIAFEKAKNIERKSMNRITADPVSYWIMKDQDGIVFIGYPTQDNVPNHFYKNRRVYAQMSAVDGKILGYWQTLIHVTFKEPA